MKFKALTAALTAAAVTVSAGAFTAFADTGDVEINNTNFPDDVFRQYVSDKCDTDGNGVLSQGEIEAVSEIVKSSYGNERISDLKGIEYFTELTSLNCRGNNLTSLDVSKNTALTSLKCSDNQLTSLDVCNNTALTELHCGDNKLTSLDISGCTVLTELACYDNQLTSLDISSCTALNELRCSDNKLKSLDVSKNTVLTELHCTNNWLKSLDVSQNTALTNLSCFDNKLKSLDVSQNTALTSFSCSHNQLTSLDVNQNTALTSLGCSDNQLTSLDVSNNTALTDLYCDNNQLKNLDVSNNTALTILNCGSNKLTSLDVSNNTALMYLYCHINQLTRLDISKNTKLSYLYCHENRLTSLDLSSIGYSDCKCEIWGNIYFIGEVTSYDLANLPEGFDISKTSNWQGATLENGILTNFTSDKITYTYDCSQYKPRATFTLTTTEITDNNSGDNSNDDPVSAFVERLYTTLLGRPSDETGKSDWVEAIDNDTTAAEAASGFVLSEELKNQNLSSGEFIDRMYRTFLDREADEAGKADWVSILDNGCSYGYILNSFAGSQEFNNLCDSYKITAGTYESTEPRDKNLDLTAFVSRMYTKALNRAYDVKGLNDWTGDYLDGKKSADDIAYGFILSQEFEGRNLTDEQYVDTLYYTFFDRDPDQGGKAGWLDELNNGTSRKDVLDGFLGAQEFANLKSSFGV